MKKMQQLSLLLDSTRNQSPSFKNAQQIVNNHIMRGKSSKKTSSKRAQVEIKSQGIKSQKIIRQSKIKQIDKKLSSLLKELFDRKCKNLSIPFNKTKFQEFLQKYFDKNSEIILNCIDLSDLNLVTCETQINKILIQYEVSSLNLSKNLIKPSIFCLQKVQNLYLNNCNLGNSELQNLFDNLLNRNRITILSLSSPEINYKNHLTKYDKLYELISKCTSLKQLYLSSCSINKENKIFQHLKGSSVKLIDLSGNEKVIGMSPALQVLNLQGNQLTRPEGLFHNDCKHSNDLRLLNISSNPIKHYDLKIFLRQGYLLKLQELKMNNLTINEQCGCLQQFLTYSNNLLRLSLVSCQLGEDSWMNVILGMKGNTSLQEINLSKNSLKSQQVAKAMGQVLGTIQLKRLNLSECLIKDEVGKWIFMNVGKNKHLKYLDISRNKLGNETGMCLSMGMKNNQCLKSVNLENNCISYLITKQLIEYTSRNSFLQTKNLVKEQQGLILLNELQRNTQQQLLSLENQLNSLREQKESIEDKLHRMKYEKINEKVSQISKQLRQSQRQQKQIMFEIQKIQSYLQQQQIQQSQQID